MKGKTLHEEKIQPCDNFKAWQDVEKVI